MKHGMVFISMGYIVSAGYGLGRCACYVCMGMLGLRVSVLAHFEIAKQEIANCYAKQSQSMMEAKKI